MISLRFDLQRIPFNLIRNDETNNIIHTRFVQYSNFFYIHYLWKKRGGDYTPIIMIS